MKRLALSIAALAISTGGFALSAADWVYDGEFLTVHSIAGHTNPQFLATNEFGELAYVDINGTTTAEIHVVGNVFADAVDSTIPVTQVNVPHSLTIETPAVGRGITGVAFQPGTGNLFACADGGATNANVQSFTRTGALAFSSNAPVSLSANQGRVHGLAFSPVNTNLLVAGELVTSRAVNIYTVSGASLTHAGKIGLSQLGVGLHVRDVAIDSNETIYANLNGTIQKITGSGLLNPASYIPANETMITNVATTANVNANGIWVDESTDEKALYAQANTSGAGPIRVFNADTAAPINQATDGDTGNGILATDSPRGGYTVRVCDSVVAESTLGKLCLFVSEGRFTGSRIVRYTLPGSSVKDWSLY